MSPSAPMTPAGLRTRDAIRQRPTDVLIALDFDGTLAPIVGNPEEAYADPAAVSALARVARLIGTVVVITGRPARTAVQLGRFREMPGLEAMIVLGQYGVERWSADGDAYEIPPEPAAIASVEAELPGVLADLDLTDARVEHKGRAIGVHTRQLADPGGSLRRLTEPLDDLASRHGLQVEPGKSVLEIRPSGMDKGEALRAIVAERDARIVIFAGDDLGDLPAFRAVAAMRDEGYEGLLVCSASHEEDALAELSDVVVEGPAGVAAWLNELADELEADGAG